MLWEFSYYLKFALSEGSLLPDRDDLDHKICVLIGEVDCPSDDAEVASAKLLLEEDGELFGAVVGLYELHFLLVLHPQ